MCAGHEADWAKITDYASSFIRITDERVAEVVPSSLGKGMI
jgi:hypothetical protein